LSPLDYNPDNLAWSILLPDVAYSIVLPDVLA
jgi:hypothetical protein